MSSLKEEYATIEELGADVIAVSADTADSHAAFAGSLGGCPFPLASDTDLEVAARYDAVDETGPSYIRSPGTSPATRDSSWRSSRPSGWSRICPPGPG